MKRSRILAILVLGGVGLWFLQRPPSETLPAPESAPEVALESETVAPSAEPQLVASAGPSTTRVAESQTRMETGRISTSQKPAVQAAKGHVAKHEGGLVEFRIVNGWAVAFGDVLLGKPEEGSRIQGGFYETKGVQLWDRPEIPFAINPSLPNPSRVRDALEYFRRNTVVNFVPYTGGEQDAIVFEPGEENCVSYLGRVGGHQPIRLTPNCQPPEIVHEIMHALGFIHEQSRTDRDQYVEVVWDNIDEKYHLQFDLVPESFMDPLGQASFDYRSAMLYRPGAFALRPPAPALRSRTSEPIYPVVTGLSPGDIDRVNRLYGTR